jgi:phosphatidylserine/phosphatidylglycerophosphate/cardiolipin synthase-like enzyme
MTAPLHLLTDSDLSALATALRSGRLAPPFSPVAVLRFSPAFAAAVSERLQGLADDGMMPRHIAALAEAILQARSGRLDEADLIDLVWTGPEASGTANRNTGVVVRELFSSARESVLVAGYAVYQGREVFRSLAARMAENPALKVRLYLDVRRQPGDATPDTELVARFARRFREQEWPGARLPEVYYDPRSLDVEAEKRSSLHAKWVVIDRQVALVTSANFTEAAQIRNIEVGALVRSRQFAARLAEHFEALAHAALLLPLRLATPCR